MLANSTGQALVKAGGDTWYFLTADYAFGAALERDTTAVVQKAGGKVLGSVKHPLNSSDFSSFLLQAQASKAKIVGLANAGGDTTNSIKQAAEFGIVAGGQKLAGLLLFITDVHSLGLNVAQGLNFTETFYWDLNDGTRAFAKRFSERMKNKAMPSMVQAGVYSGLIHYFKALEAMGGNPHDGVKAVEKMKSMPTDDPLFGQGSIRVDGRKIHPAYLFEVKKPSESKGPWDYYKLVGTVAADQAFRPLSESACPLVKK
jgi:branched-chain amino acid transport system substrate-binding protein